MKNATLSGSMPKRNVIGRFVENNRKAIVEVIAALFILLFVYTGINKLITITTLSNVLKDYPLIGTLSPIISWSLPITELSISLLLFIPRTKLLGLYISFILMSVFTLFLIYMLIFVPKLPCTCGGMLQELSWPQHLLFNLFFVSISILAIKLYKKETLRSQFN